jgi:hypothetical protein
MMSDDLYPSGPDYAAILAAGHAIVVGWCKGCERGTPSQACSRCRTPKAACSACGRCPACDPTLRTRIRVWIWTSIWKRFHGTT